MILLMRGTPDGAGLTDLAKVHWLADRGRHFAPVTITTPAKVATDIADDHTNIARLY
jgi:hypothetical protein